MLDGEAAGDLGEEAGQLGRLAQLAPAELLEADAEGVLEEVLRLGPAVGVAVEDDRHTAAVQLDHPLLRAPVSRADARDQFLRPFGGLSRSWPEAMSPRGPAWFPLEKKCGRILARGSAGYSSWLRRRRRRRRAAASPDRHLLGIAVGRRAEEMDVCLPCRRTGLGGGDVDVERAVCL